jgi:hypothetical protein
MPALHNQLLARITTNPEVRFGKRASVDTGSLCKKSWNGYQSELRKRRFFLITHSLKRRIF